MLKITVLSENQTKNPELKSEHGFSLYVETDNKNFIFDTGASGNFIENAGKLEVDLEKINSVILSHGHYDHTGGLSHFKNKVVYAHPDLFIPKYKKTDNLLFEYIGNEYVRCFYEHNNKLEIRNVTESIELFADINLVCGFKKAASENYFYVKPPCENLYIKDSFNDELVLTINTANGLVIITGCAHSGIINIIEKCLQITGQSKIFALLGGFHLSKIEEKEVKEIAGKIDAYHIENIGISHCTGDVLAKYLTFGKVFNFNTGDEFNA